jgi:hypothetical protein
MKAFFRQSALALALTSLVGYAFAADNKLVVTVADMSGRCLLENSWVDVTGRYIYWEMSGSQVPVKWHRSDLIFPRVSDPDKALTDSSVLRAPFAFAVNLLEMSPTGKARELTWPELSFRDAMRIKLGKPNLVAATVVHRVRVRDLWLRNLTNTDSIFKPDSDSEQYVPVRYSVCDVEIKYLMKGAEAVFEKSIIGKTVIKTNHTVPLKAGESSFAEELLNRRK